ncbi:MAG: hypothetical protein JNL85_13490 [Rubrivivax sp.]|nr:hypothetical protein [Rubrivivax sp.]
MNTWLPPRLLPSMRRLRLLCAGLSAALLVSCGGDDDGARYRSVAVAGELIDYTLDTTNLTYTYTITESQFGLAGTTGSGTLTLNTDGSYTPSGAPDSRVVVLANGIMLGAVRERFGAAVVTMPIIGLRDPVTTTAALAAEYNYVQRGCAGALCSASLGTLRIDASGAWNSCRDGNIAAGACTGAAASGTLEPRGEGQWRMKSDDGTDIGTAIGFDDAGQKGLVVDLRDPRAGGFGSGILLAGQQAAMTPATADGNWIAALSSGPWVVFEARGTTIAISQYDGMPVDITVTFSANDPWAGMATTAWGEDGFMAGSGFYVLKTPGGDLELGVKLP